ncbi:ShlB/FhaC/HecB family hemolysin secretion/activation protein [Moraxella haemolytica]|uniref:ShlB/FhaC/HecB family hemolysin secretion/activation protein n=1 Tax=Moraxella haemolytica TaxID=2904119 RepID=UPI002542AC40|nr:ShlB/FhaC/HecB family hemolysin secretion/activation protein [Moraxella sp. ZY171148]WII94524.1 ShlB/FhaC/HecB family hemolysin secretion/activation protein [Moraxella sp. ZY171148]
MRLTSLALTIFTAIHATQFNIIWAQTPVIKSGIFTLTDDRRQAALAHLAQQNLQIPTSINANDSQDKQTDITHPDWQNPNGDDSCFMVDEIDFVIDGSGLAYNDLSTLLSPLLDWKKPTYAIGRCINNHNLSIIVDIAHNELLKRGYLTSNISVGEQDLLTKKLILTVNLGKVRDVVLTHSIKTPFYIHSAISTKPNQAFRLADLEHGLDTLKRIDPTATVQIIPSSSGLGNSDIDNPSLVSKNTLGFSDLVINMNRSQSAVFGINIDNSLSKDYGKYMIAANVRANNLFHMNDEWNFSANYPLIRLIDLTQNNLGVQVNKDRQINYHVSSSTTYGPFKFSITHSYHQYKQFIEGLNAPLTYHGTSQTNTLGLFRLLYRSGTQKTEGYIKANHKQSNNYIDDVNIEVQNRRTTGYNLGITHQHYFRHGGYLYANLDYQQGTGALKAKPAPEERIYNAFGQQLPSEGYSRAPIWSLYTSFHKPFTINSNSNRQLLNTNQNSDQQTTYTPISLSYITKIQAQYAKQPPTPSNLFYLGGRNSIKGIKEGNYLSGEHGFSLSQELTWQLPSQKTTHHLSKQLHSAELYASIDQGYVYGQNTIKNQRYILAGAIGMRYHFQSKPTQVDQEKQDTLSNPLSNLSLNNQPLTAHLDIFVGKGLKVPTFMKKETIIGVSAGFDF